MMMMMMMMMIIIIINNLLIELMMHLLHLYQHLYRYWIYQLGALHIWAMHTLNITCWQLTSEFNSCEGDDAIVTGLTWSGTDCFIVCTF